MKNFKKSCFYVRQIHRLLLTNVRFHLCVSHIESIFMCVCRWSSVRTTRKLWNRSMRTWSTGLDSSDTNANNVSPKSLSTWSACANWSSRDSKYGWYTARYYRILLQGAGRRKLLYWAGRMKLWEDNKVF